MCHGILVGSMPELGWNLIGRLEEIHCRPIGHSSGRVQEAGTNRSQFSQCKWIAMLIVITFAFAYNVFFVLPQLEINPNRSAVGIQSLCNAIQKLDSRLTHLYLAHNRLAGIPQLVTALSVRINTITILETCSLNRFFVLFSFFIRHTAQI